MNEVRVNGITMHLAEVPPEADGPRYGATAVLIHGIAPDNLASWYLTLAYPLAGLGMRVLMYDMRGHGRTERPRTGYRFADLLDDLDALMLHWAVAGPVHLIGNSLGGALAFGYAARHPERVAGIVAIEADAPTADYFGRLSKVVDALTLVPDDGRPAASGPRALLRKPQVLALLNETSMRRELPAGPAPDPDRLAAVDCPVLCLYGGRSPVRRRAPATRRLMPQTKTVVFADQQHTLLMDDHREVREHVLAWLSQQPVDPVTGPHDERAAPAGPRSSA